MSYYNELVSVVCFKGKGDAENLEFYAPPLQKSLVWGKKYSANICTCISFVIQIS